MQRGNTEMAKSKNKIATANNNRELTLVEKGFIESKKSLTSAELYHTYFADTDVNKEMIDGFLEELRQVKMAGPAGQAIINEKHEHGRKGMAIMTREASEISDDRRSTYRPSVKDDSGHIFKIDKTKK